MQFKAHTTTKNGNMKEHEVTALQFDPTFRRLLTAGAEGNVKIWNFNNGHLLRVLPDVCREETASIAFYLQLNIITGGWSRQIYVYNDDEDDETVEALFPKHSEDITCIAVHEKAQVFVSAAYNGDMYLWSASSLRMLGYMNHNVSTNHLPPYHYNKGENVQQIMGGRAGSRQLSLPSMAQTLMDVKLKAFRKREPSTFDPDKLSKNLIKKCIDSGTAAVVKIVCLTTRPIKPDLPSLFTAAADGVVRAWSLHNQGGLLGQFYASAPHKGLTDMVTSIDEDLLITADAAGYVRVWCIDHYFVGDQHCTLECETRWENTPYRKLVVLMEAFGKTDKLQCYPDPPNLHLVSAFRCHLEIISAVDFMYVGEHSCIITASMDKSVRVWTLDGQFLGLCGQSHLWNIVYLNLPIWRDGEYRWKRPAHLVAKENPALPDDLLRECEMPDLFMLKRGQYRRWRHCIHIVRMFLIRSRYEELVIAEIEAKNKAKLMEKQGRHFEMLKDKEADRPVLGKYFVWPHRGSRNKGKNPLLQVASSKRILPCYRALPITPYYKAFHPMSDPFLRRVRQTFDLSPIEHYKGIGTLFQKAVKTNLMTAAARALAGPEGTKVGVFRPHYDFLTAAAIADVKCSLIRMRKRGGRAAGPPMPWEKLIGIAEQPPDEKKRMAKAKRRGRLHLTKSKSTPKNADAAQQHAASGSRSSKTQAETQVNSSKTQAETQVNSSKTQAETQVNPEDKAGDASRKKVVIAGKDEKNTNQNKQTESYDDLDGSFTNVSNCNATLFDLGDVSENRDSITFDDAGYICDADLVGDSGFKGYTKLVATESTFQTYSTYLKGIRNAGSPTGSARSSSHVSLPDTVEFPTEENALFLQEEKFAYSSCSDLPNNNNSNSKDSHGCGETSKVKSHEQNYEDGPGSHKIFSSGKNLQDISAQSETNYRKRERRVRFKYPHSLKAPGDAQLDDKQTGFLGNGKILVNNEDDDECVLPSKEQTMVKAKIHHYSGLSRSKEQPVGLLTKRSPVKLETISHKKVSTNVEGITNTRRVSFTPDDEASAKHDIEFLFKYQRGHGQPALTKTSGNQFPSPSFDPGSLEKKRTTNYEGALERADHCGESDRYGDVGTRSAPRRQYSTLPKLETGYRQDERGPSGDKSTAEDDILTCPPGNSAAQKLAREKYKVSLYTGLPALSRTSDTGKVRQNDRADHLSSGLGRSLSKPRVARDFGDETHLAEVRSAVDKSKYAMKTLPTRSRNRETLPSTSSGTTNQMTRGCISQTRNQATIRKSDDAFTGSIADVNESTKTKLHLPPIRMS